MKKFLLLLVVLGILFGGCASIKQSEFWDHSSHYKNWDHMKFSWGGYKTPDCQDCVQSDAENWWGIGVEADCSN